MTIEDSALKLKNLITRTYDFENYKENIEIMNVYFLYLVNNQNYSLQEKNFFMNIYLETNNDYVINWLNNFFLESILKLKERKKNLEDNDYFLFKYLSNKEIIKRIFYVNLQSAIFYWQKVSKYFINDQIVDDTLLQKIKIFTNIYYEIYNEKINIRSPEDFFNAKNNIIKNDEIAISYIMNDYFFIKENSKLKISNKIKNFIILIFNLKIDDSNLNIDLENIDDIKDNIKKMITKDL